MPIEAVELASSVQILIILLLQFNNLFDLPFFPPP
jgi:hypothetical protein